MSIEDVVEHFSGYEAMGKPIPNNRVDAGFKFLEELGLDSNVIHILINIVVRHLERDEPEQAMSYSLGDMDLTASYRLMSYLLTA